MIAYCGLKCDECDVYLATMAKDSIKRAEVALKWSKMLNIELKAEDINCDGCKTENGRLFSHCNNCKIRSCAQNRQVENCAHCRDYSCEKLDELFTHVPESKTTLDTIKSGL